MAVNHIVEVYTQKSIYTQSNNNLDKNRKLKVYFSIPEKGVNEDTGILLFIAGFGGQATSNVYRKMRDKFADDYNLVTIQCDYFGYEFMQTPEKILVSDLNINQIRNIFSTDDVNEIYKSGRLNFNKFLDLGAKYNINITVRADLSGETPDNFNDMGLLQAIDNITAVLSIMNILSDNGLCFNTRKVITYGHSHGAYLSYLCNAFAPLLFTLIIDNSAWLYPVYLFSNRLLVNQIGKMQIVTEFDYLAKSLVKDFDILKLPYLYSEFNNICKIISFHGSSDTLISNTSKSLFCKSVNNCIYNEISEADIDNIIFKSTTHGLGADFLKLFDYAMAKFSPEFDKDDSIDLVDMTFKTDKNEYFIDYESVIPKIEVHPIK